MYVEYVTFEGTKVPSYVRVHTRTQLHISYARSQRKNIERTLGTTTNLSRVYGRHGRGHVLRKR